MVLLFLASLAGLFPDVVLPLSVGWKAIAVFDALFAAAVLEAWRRRALRALDRRLCAAAAAFVLAGVASVARHLDPAGVRLVVSIAYSAIVFLIAAHFRVTTPRVRRLILGPIALTLVVAWTVFALENIGGMTIGQNQSMALPVGVHRLGGLTGGNALVLFIALAAPFAHSSWAGVATLLVSGYATLSRSIVGVGLGVLLGPVRGRREPGRTRVATAGLAAIAVAMGSAAYLFSTPAPGAPARLSIPGSGSYPGLHRAALRMWASSPLTGVGPGGFASRWIEFSTEAERRALPGPDPDHSRWDPHSALLGLAAEQGLVGVAAFGWLASLIFGTMRQSADPDHRRAALAAFAGLMAGGALVDWFALKGLWLWLGLMVAAARERAAEATAEA